MKLRSTILMSVMICFTWNVSAQISRMAISNADSSEFVLMVDNVSYGQPSKSFTVDNLTPGIHRIQMAKPAPSTPTGRRSLVPEVYYDGFVNVPDSSMVTAVSPERGRLNIVSIVPILQYLYGIITGNGNNGLPGNGGWGNGTGNNPWGLPFPPFPPQGMNANDFEMLKATVRGKSFESAKLEICRQALQYNRVTSSQVAQLMDLMTFESSKLELAKFAYGRVVDKGNYYLVNNSFTFGSSISELGDYINGTGFGR